MMAAGVRYGTPTKIIAGTWRLSSSASKAGWLGERERHSQRNPPEGGAVRSPSKYPHQIIDQTRQRPREEESDSTRNHVVRGKWFLQSGNAHSLLRSRCKKHSCPLRQLQAATVSLEYRLGCGSGRTSVSKINPFPSVFPVSNRERKKEREAEPALSYSVALYCTREIGNRNRSFVLISVFHIKHQAGASHSPRWPE